MRGDGPIPWREIVSRTAMVLFAAGLGAGGTLLIVGGVGAFDYSPGAGVVFIILGAFLLLVAGTLFCFAFVPARDTPTGPPRGFAVVSAIFDGFWSMVESLLRMTGRY